MEQQIIKVGNEFTISKTDNRFVEVVFEYPKSDKWEGCFPVYYPNMSIEFSSDEVKEQIPNVYEAMRPSNRINLIEAARNRWPKGRETGA